jgi:hypothetical protein
MNLKFWKTKPVQTPYFARPRILSDAEQKRANVERLMELAGVTPDTAWWKTILSYADEHASNAQIDALLPDLPDSVRQYNAGRAAGALDFAQALRDLRLEAVQQAKKLAKDD